MRIGRTLPPAASPIYPRDILSGIKGIFRGKKELERFESELEEYFRVKHCFLVSSGKAALTLILQALKELYPDRDEVLIPAFTCYSVPSSTVRAGLKVKPCDIDPDTLDFDFNQLSKLLSQCPSAKASNDHSELFLYNQQTTSLPQARRSSNEAVLQPNASSNRLLAIIPVHLFGLPADIARLRKIVNDPEITIVEDAAQTMGAEWNGKKLGTLGDVSFFSLGRGKAISTVEGGIILTDRGDISEKIRVQMEEVPHYSIFGLLALFFNGIALSFFMHPTRFWLPKSLPFLKLGDTIYNPHFKMRKMSAFQAGLARTWRGKLKALKEIRRRNSRKWTSVSKAEYLHCYCSENGAVPDMIRYPVRIDNEAIRAKLLRESERMGLGIMFTYPNSIDGIQELRDNFQGLDYPVAKEIAHQMVTLPIHLFVSQKDKAEILALISQIT